MVQNATSGVMKISHAGKTDPGQKRENNEDAILIAPEYGIFLLADGLGGHAFGELASEIALREAFLTMRGFLRDEDATGPYTPSQLKSSDEDMLTATVKVANKKVFELSRQKEQTIASTIVILYLKDRKAVLANAGDSRAYRIRGSSMEQITEDHTFVGEQLRRGIITSEEAKSHSMRNILMRSLGNEKDVEVDTKTLEVNQGDIFILCSDGLSGFVTDGEIKQIVIEHDQDLEKACNRLIDYANLHGGEDNISVILVKCGG